MLTARRARGHRDGGSVAVLIIGCTAIAAALIVLGVDVSKVFLARRALASAADSAALAAAQGIDTRSLYAGAGPHCGDQLPLSDDRAITLATDAVRDAAPGLHRTFVSLDDPQTTVNRRTVTVSMSGEVAVPFGRIIGWLDPALSDGRVRVRETSHAASPVVGNSTC